MLRWKKISPFLEATILSGSLEDLSFQIKEAKPVPSDSSSIGPSVNPYGSASSLCTSTPGSRDLSRNDSQLISQPPSENNRHKDGSEQTSSLYTVVFQPTSETSGAKTQSFIDTEKENSQSSLQEGEVSLTSQDSLKKKSSVELVPYFYPSDQEKRVLVNQCIHQGNELITQGNHLINEGNELIAQGDYLIGLGKELIAQGNYLIDLGNKLITQGDHLIHQGNELITQGKQLEIQLICCSEETTQKILDQDILNLESLWWGGENLW